MPPKYRCTEPQEILLREEVEKRNLLVDPSTSNNSRVKEGAWEEVTKTLNTVFATTLSSHF